MALPPLRNCDYVSIDFSSNSKQDVQFHHIAYDYSCADWDGLCHHLKDAHGMITLELVLLLLLVNFVSGFRLYISQIQIYIPHCKYQVKPHLSPWFSAACTAAIVHRNRFFCFTN